MYDLVTVLSSYGETVDKVISMARDVVAVADQRHRENQELRDRLAILDSVVKDLDQQLKAMMAQRENEMKAKVGCEADAELHRPEGHKHEPGDHGGHGDK